MTDTNVFSDLSLGISEQTSQPFISNFQPSADANLSGAIGIFSATYDTFSAENSFATATSPLVYQAAELHGGALAQLGGGKEKETRAFSRSAINQLLDNGQLLQDTSNSRQYRLPGIQMPAHEFFFETRSRLSTDDPDTVNLVGKEIYLDKLEDKVMELMELPQKTKIYPSADLFLVEDLLSGADDPIDSNPVLELTLPDSHGGHTIEVKEAENQAPEEFFTVKGTQAALDALDQLIEENRPDGQPKPDQR